MIVYGRNATREAIKARLATKVIVLERMAKDEVTLLAKAENVSVEIAKEADLTRIARSSSHQGFAAICNEKPTVSLDFLIEEAGRVKYPLLLMLDGIEDPHNLGAILRTVDCLGVQGVIIKSRGEAPINSTVAKVSTGASCWVNIAVVANLNRAIDRLKQKGFWIVSSDGEANQSYQDVDYKCPICLVVGSEGFGISKLVLKNSDFIVKIPMSGHVNSLNASVSAAILIAMIQSKRA